MTSRLTRFVLLSIAFFIAGWAVAAYRSSRPPASEPHLVRMPPPTLPTWGIVVEGIVSDYHPAKPGEPVDVLGESVMSKIWLVKLDRVSAIQGECPEKTLAILVHSPSMNLGVRRKGQTIRVTLESRAGPVEVIVPPGQATSSLPNLSRVKYRLRWLSGPRHS